MYIGYIGYKLLGMEDDFMEESPLDGLTEKEQEKMAQLILEEAYYNSYLVVTERMTFEELIDEYAIDKGTALLAHDPDEKIAEGVIVSMIEHFSSPEQEEYEKCAELVKRLNLLYPDTVEKLI